MVYKFRLGSYKGLDPQETGSELERIRQENGGQLNTHAVWKQAKKKGSPIHSAFTWDLEKAAEAHWAFEARALIKAVVLVENETERSAFINVSVHQESTDEQEEKVERYYQAVHVLPGSPIEYESALAAAKVRVASANSSFDELLSIAPRGRKASIKRAHKHVRAAHQELAA